ncbi:lysoplasmalogenase [Celeribacter naphthalenivorans]|uniref:lysoplasmalogenase n=1 Tax=Celeribacter naphthalenivorans TaxID=1614694 RepID=UPI001CFAF26B|nr:lysoplasmalogenase [Celeribacter naphthalenivorans]
MNIILWGLAGASALAYLPMTGRAPTLWRSGIKTIPLSLFALLAFLHGGSSWLIFGLVLSALGDLALSREGKRHFLIGLVSFALAHLCYVFLFWAKLDTLFWPGIVLLAGVALSTEFWLAPHTGALRAPVRVYVLLISVMTVLALSLPETWRLASLGAVLFLLSDLILAIQLFRMTPGTRAARRAGYLLWTLYICGQGAILLAFVPRVWGLS